MPYENYSDDELAHLIDIGQCDIEAITKKQKLVEAEQERRRKPAIGTIYKHRYSWGDRGHWVATAYEGAAVTMLYFDISEWTTPHTSAWLPGQIKNNLIEQTLTTKEEES